MLRGKFKESLGKVLKDNFSIRSFIAFGLFIIYSHCFCFAQGLTDAKLKLGVYAVVSSSSDTATIKMTEDLYYSQLSTLNDYIIIDKRKQNYVQLSTEEQKSVDIVFYPEIQQKDGLWDCTLIVIDTINKKTFTDNRQYESYYKILMDAKNSVTELLYNVAELHKPTDITENTIDSLNIPKITIEQLSGTWKGEDYIDKIIILRGGRGFIIFKNGASMNISLSITDNTVIAKQTSKTNASYFPDIPRNVALMVAPNTQPIIWTLNLIDTNILSGNKSTIKYSSELNTTEGVILPVKWIRQ